MSTYLRVPARRFLIRISYNGTRYCGIDRKSVIGEGVLVNVKRTIDKTIYEFLKSRYENFRLSSTSRTDKGVHAMSNTLRLILYSDCSVDLSRLTLSMNNFLRKACEEIRVQKIQEIPFYVDSAVHVEKRTYVYRLAIFKSLQVQEMDPEFEKHVAVQNAGPVFHDEFCVTLTPPFSVDKFLESAELLCGINDFRNFTNKNGIKDLESKKTGNKSTVRSMEIDIKRGHPFLLSLQPHLADQLEFWEIHFKSQSYIYNQVRRMVGWMVSYAQGCFDKEILKKVLYEKALSEKEMNFYAHWNTVVMPPNGLFLKDVQYNEECLKKSAKTEEEYIDLLANMTVLQQLLHKQSYRNKTITLADIRAKHPHENNVDEKIEEECADHKKSEHVTTLFKSNPYYPHKTFISRKRWESNEKYINKHSRITDTDLGPIPIFAKRKNEQ